MTSVDPRRTVQVLELATEVLADDGLKQRGILTHAARCLVNARPSNGKPTVLYEETDRRFWIQTGYKPGQQLDMSDPRDRGMARVWMDIFRKVQRDAADGKLSLARPEPDTQTWLSRGESADVLACTVGTLKRYEKRGWLHPRYVRRANVRGAPCVVIVYDPRELIAVARRNRDREDVTPTFISETEALRRGALLIEKAIGLVTSDNSRVADDVRLASLRRAALLARHHILSVALFLGGLAGALDATLRALIAAHCAGDAAALPVLLDRALERGLDGLHASWLPKEERQRWLLAAKHEHMWLLWVSGDEERAVRPYMSRGALIRCRRCTCGLFEHEWHAERQLARRGTAVTPHQDLDASPVYRDFVSAAVGRMSAGGNLREAVRRQRVPSRLNSAQVELECVHCGRQVALTYDERRGCYQGTCPCGTRCTTG